jgi:hypothetical protein
MPFWVIKMKLLDNYKVHIVFNDGLSGVIDFQNKLMTDHRDIVRDLIDKDKFKAIKIERHTLCWDNGVDFAPEYLYDKIKVEEKVA